ncbi:hypothetical protein PM082_010255 [Marasmius tenuissimus]|nr:hypothetical protein PM082_010255 [Marasmius tenuissimus]
MGGQGRRLSHAGLPARRPWPAGSISVKESVTWASALHARRGRCYVVGADSSIGKGGAERAMSGREKESVVPTSILWSQVLYGDSTVETCAGNSTTVVLITAKSLAILRTRATFDTARYHPIAFIHVRAGRKPSLERPSRTESSHRDERAPIRCPHVGLLVIKHTHTTVSFNATTPAKALVIAAPVLHVQSRFLGHVGAVPQRRRSGAVICGLTEVRYHRKKNRVRCYATNLVRGSGRVGDTSVTAFAVRWPPSQHQ